MAITVHLSGGLGNQMFQYAAGRALALARSTDLVLDTSSFSHDELRSYLLGHYPLKGSVMKPMSWIMKKISGFVRTYFGLYPKLKVYGEKSNTFDEDMLALPDNTYLLGHWQSEKYFQPYAKIIRSELKHINNLRPSIESLRNKIIQTHGVAIHIRRGDYVVNPTAAQVLGTLPLSYYKLAHQYLKKKLKSKIHYYVFSDDPQWVKKNLKKFAGTTVSYLDSRHHSAIEDFELMRSCSHFIIANSSFSWWAAWLGTKKGTTVIAPKRWFASSKYSSKDLVPKQWIQI